MSFTTNETWGASRKFMAVSKKWPPSLTIKNSLASQRGRAAAETWIEEAKNQTALAQIKTDDFWANSALFQCAILAYNMLMALCSGNAIAPLGTGHHAHLSCPNGRKMDEWRSSTKTESSGKNTLQCSMGCMGRCWRDLAPLFHYSGNVLLRSRSPNPGRSTS